MKVQTWITDNADMIECDMHRALNRWPDGVPGLRDALVAGRINGGRFYGRCACLAGTLMRFSGEVPEPSYEADADVWEDAQEAVSRAVRPMREAFCIADLPCGASPAYQVFLCTIEPEWTPFEALFASIRPGDTPGTNPASRFALGVVDRWIADRGADVLAQLTERAVNRA